MWKSFVIRIQDKILDLPQTLQLTKISSTAAAVIICLKLERQIRDVFFEMQPYLILRRRGNNYGKLQISLRLTDFTSIEKSRHSIKGNIAHC